MSIKAYRWFSLVCGILLIIFSFMLFSNPVSGLITVAVFLGIALLIHGFGELSMYFSLPHGAKSGWLLAGGLVSIIFGFWILTAQGTLSISVALPFILGAWILFTGILKIVSCITLREFSKQLTTINLILGIIGIVLGIILLHHPAIGSVIISVVVFVIFLVQGIGCIANFFWCKDLE
ncbi:DUF308 domain-containing protein [uncultured Fusobacterium sp.]|uniref:HdeD family acid-resistance protein n=1 Tax=uncultured Fusobacterium sp. TaxID=159267 RepID=UPI002592AB16|nr:DUF308 domain-containing protein [uncultured Fusobacterium sp.]